MNLIMSQTQISMLEKDLVNACLEILALKGIFSWRNNTGAFSGEYKGKKRFVRFGEVGSPDIIAVYDGQFIGVECKVGKNTQSEKQKEFQNKLEEAGGLYWLVYTPEEFTKLLFYFL